MLHGFRYHSTHCFFAASARDGKLLAIDAGWPLTLHEYQRAMKKSGLKYQDLAWAIVTHFHLDHAGLVTDFLADGITCFVFENQMGAIDAMEKTIWKNDPAYRAIDQSKLTPVRLADSRELLRTLGIQGEILLTDGHSPDSISFLSDEHAVVIGDLYPREVVMPDDVKSNASWELILEKGGKKIFPSHANFFTV
jgi:glyoxylase-like metal-dependent hydrolase (beta-lactamase superfamily II)